MSKEGYLPADLEGARREYDYSYGKKRFAAQEAETPGATPAREVKEFIDSHKGRLGRDVLDLGSGLGRNLVYLAQQGLSVTGIDISHQGTAGTREWLSALGLEGNVVEGDIARLPFVESTFDSVISRRVLDYADTAKVRAILLEVNRTLRPGGVFYLVVRSISQPSKDIEELKEENEFGGRVYVEQTQLGPGSNQHYFSREEIERLAREAGFEVESIKEIKKTDAKEGRLKAQWEAILVRNW